MTILKKNLHTILSGFANEKELEILYRELLEYMIQYDWRGACHESCGVQYVLLTEMGIPCEWIVGEVFFKEKKYYNTPICFDHSWILISGEIFDLSLIRSNISSLDSPPTICGKNLENLKEPEVIYNTNSGHGDDSNTIMIKSMPLSIYFDNSPLHPQLGTWALVTTIGKKLNLNLDINILRQKYNGIFWK